jgi:dTDP-4-amino-4,6-dideoxygalactose transaminase
VQQTEIRQDVQPIDLAAERAELGGLLERALLRAFESGQYVLGPEIEAFEREFAQYQHARHGVGVASGTDALILALRALGVGPGTSVVAPAFTFFATAAAAAWLGARPRLVDVEPDTGLIEPAAAAAAIEGDTRCLVPVHLYGQLADVRALRALADARGIALLEDAAQAHGALRDGVRAGELGDLTAFSFYPTKNLGAAGDAGMVLGRDEALVARVRRLRDHGSAAKYEHVEVGTNSRLSSLQAAVLRVKLPHLEAWIARRAAVAEIYAAVLGASELVRPLARVADARHAWHQFAVRIPGEGRRDRVLAGLRERRIFASVHYPRPVHLQPAARDWGYGAGDFPHSEALAREVLCLPIHPYLAEPQVRRVAESVLELSSTA